VVISRTFAIAVSPANEGPVLRWLFTSNFKK